MIKTRFIPLSLLVAGFLATSADARAQSDSLVPIASSAFGAEVDVPRFDTGPSFNMPVQPRLQLGPVRFASNSADLGEVERKQLEEDLVTLRAYPDARIRIVVFGDGLGGPMDALARKRGAMISNLLAEQKVDPSRIDVDVRPRDAGADPAPSVGQTRIIDIVTAG